MGKKLRGLVYTNAALLLFGSGWFSNSLYNAPTTNDFDYKNYKPGTNFEVVFQVYDEKKKEWIDDRRGLIDKFNLTTQTAEGVNNLGQRSRGFIRYNSPEDVASK
jgi:hypothetical protein